MGSHRDYDSPLPPKMLREMREAAEIIASREQSLMRRMQEATEQGSNLITAGVDGEQVLFDRVVRNMLVRRLPNDPDGVLRISLGCPEWDSHQAYCVFRGDPSAIYDLLRKAMKVMQSFLPGMPREEKP